MYISRISLSDLFLVYRDIYTVGHKKRATLPIIDQFSKTFFTGTFCGQLAIKWLLNISPQINWQTDKVAGVRASTDGAAPPQYATAPPGCSLHQFSQLTTDDVVAAVRQLPDTENRLNV